jgi:hypothetical protein
MGWKEDDGRTYTTYDEIVGRSIRQDVPFFTA